MGRFIPGNLASHPNELWAHDGLFLFAERKLGSWPTPPWCWRTKLHEITVT